MTGRLAEIEAEITRLEDRFARQITASTSGRHVGREEAKRHSVVIDGLTAALDQAKAKRANLMAGLPEDTGLGRPLDIEAIVDARVQYLIDGVASGFASAINEKVVSRIVVIEKRLGIGVPPQTKKITKTRRDEAGNLVAETTEVDEPQPTPDPVGDLNQRLVAVEERVAELTDRGLRYRGIWQRADYYRRGDAVTHAGSLWIAIADRQPGAPGDGPSNPWVLAAKGVK